MKHFKKKILINALNLNGQYSGVQYYIRNLLYGFDNLSQSKFDFTPLVSKEISMADLVKTIPSNISFHSENRIKRILFENHNLKRIYKAGNFNLYHSTSYVLPYLWKAPSIITLHDLIALEFPKLSKNSTALYYKFMMERSLKKATKIIAVSNKVKADLLSRFNLPEDKIKVIHLGISSKFKKISDEIELNGIRKKYDLPIRFILFVGNIEPKKNLLLVLRAFHILKQDQNIDHKLIIVGRRAWKYQKVFNEVARLKLVTDVQFLGYVDEYDLPGIYSLSKLFLFPSIYEGFGLPPLEAMACETPVIVSSAGSLPEVTGNLCPQVSPYSTESLFNEIESIINNEYRYNCKEASKWVSQFTWEKAACETQELYAQVLS